MNEGLKIKYDVYKVEDGSLVKNCFVLRPDKDPYAVYALIEYASKTDNKELSDDIREWLDRLIGDIK